MTHTATVRVATSGPEEAERLAASLTPDDDGFLDVSTEGGALVLRAEAEHAMGLVRTLDDALGCLRATGMK